MQCILTTRVVSCCGSMQCSHYEEKLKSIQSNTNAVSPAERQQVYIFFIWYYFYQYTV